MSAKKFSYLGQFIRGLRTPGLRIRKNVVKRSLNEQKKLQFEFTIRNLKEEVKDDEKSSLSDGE